MTDSATVAVPTPLAGLLRDLERPPFELCEAIRAERERRSTDPTVAAELDVAELAFLRRIVRQRRLRGEVIERVEAAWCAGLSWRLAQLRTAGDDDPVAMLDLVELEVDLRLAGGAAMLEAADTAAAEASRRAAAIDVHSDQLRYLAGERFAGLSTEEQEIDLPRRIELLRRTGWLFARLGERDRSLPFRRWAVRLVRQANDRSLQLRLERLFSRRGVALLEHISLTGLFVVIGLLVLELWTGPAEWIERVDAWICTFFIAEFLIKLALAPARVSWFLRNALTDLLPAIPAALFFVVSMPEVASATAAARAARLLRSVVWIARYVRAMRPLVDIFRFGLFLVRGADGLVRRFSRLLNRDFVFFERGVLPLPTGGTSRSPRTELGHAQRREHVLLSDMPATEAVPLLIDRAQRLSDRFATRGPIAADSAAPMPVSRLAAGAVPVEHAIEFLWGLRAEELSTWLPRRDITAIDRLVLVMNAPVIRSTPLVRSLRVPAALETAEERVVALAHRVALLLESWRERVLWVADLHGIVTGPQMLDRVASTLVAAVRRPAVRLLLFGGVFSLLRLLVQKAFGPGTEFELFLARFVATPLVVIGSVCLVLLLVGRWLKKLAGEASDAFKLTAEAHFVGLVELVKRRHQTRDLAFLAQRVFGDDLPGWEAAAALAAHLDAARNGRFEPPPEGMQIVADEVYRVGLLYLHFLDGAPLHANDVKTTEQLLANLSLENIRNTHLDWSRRDIERLRRLAPSDGAVFGGPFLWFRLITESVVVETAKLVTEYNRLCLTRTQREVASSEERRAFARWMRHRRAPVEHPEPVAEAPGGLAVYRTTEFNALDFLTEDPQRAHHIERIFGRRILRLMRRDRARMIREVFGTRPLHELPRSRRTLNFLRFYEQRLSHGRFFLAPIYGLSMTLLGSRLMVRKTVEVVREILTPRLAARHRSAGRAPFAVAMRKIHRMKAPTLLEAMRLRAQFDPAYCGAPGAWSFRSALAVEAEIERDMAFLGLREHEREPLQELARRNRRRVAELHNMIRRRGVDTGRVSDPEQRLRGERAVTIAYLTDRDHLRTLLRAQTWLERELPQMESADLDLPDAWLRRGIGWLLRGTRRHPVDRWIDHHLADRNISRRGRGNFKRAWQVGRGELRRMVAVWGALPTGAIPFDLGVAAAQRIFQTRDDFNRELAALRAVQTMSVMDVRNYRELVFELGDYESDGEDRRLASAVP